MPKKLVLPCNVILLIALVLLLAPLSVQASTQNHDSIICLADNSTAAANTSPHIFWIGQMLPWGIDRIDTTLVDSFNTGKGVKIAMLDTGIDLDHPDLKVAGNVSFVEGALTGDDDNGHGTMVAGIIGAQDNSFGMVGIAPEASLYAVKVIAKDGKGSIDAVVKGIDWSIENKMQIINLSFGDPLQMPQSVVDALQKASDAGILIVAGAGNDGESGKEDCIWYPAHYENVIAVGSTDSLDVKAPFSSVGPSLDLVAPGVSVVTCDKDGTYVRTNGTSFSASFVSGVAALVFAAGVNDNRQVKDILIKSAEDLGAAGWDNQYGYGLVNANRALRAASNLIPSVNVQPVVVTP